MTFPDFDSLDILQYQHVSGFCSLGLIAQHRPDLTVLYLSHQKFFSYSTLDNTIKKSLSEGKKVCLFPWEEDFSADMDPNFVKMLNQYQNDPVYWITQKDSMGVSLIQEIEGMKLKVVEILWWWLNDCLLYYATKSESNSQIGATDNFLCAISRFEQHKYNLVKELTLQNLAAYGSVTINKSTLQDYPLDAINYCTPSDDIIYPHKVNPIHLNVKNFVYLNNKYAQPLIINAETAVGAFFSTEKSIWPILLGRMFLIYGRPGCMQWIQRFYDVDLTKYCNVEFDNITGYTPESDYARLKCMLSQNKDLIQNSKDIYTQLSPELESAKYSFGKNLYNFCIRQLDLII
jgi:hypothetical protein